MRAAYFKEHDWAPSNAALPANAASESLPPVNCLLMDAAGTLYDDTTWPRWLLQLLARMGLHTQYAPFMHVFQAEYLRQAYVGQCDYWEALRAMLLASGLTRGQVEEVEAAGRLRRLRWRQMLRPLPGVAATLSALKGRGLRLAVLANTSLSSAEMVETLARMGLQSYFELVASSRDLGCAKPDSAAFETALSMLQVAGEDAAYISGAPDELTGAAACGLRTIALGGDEQTSANCHLTQFEQLPNLIASAAQLKLAG